MVNYKNGKIYKLVNSICNEGNCYYGSTCNELRIRKQQHKCKYKLWKKRKMCFITSFKLFEEDYENVKIVLVEEFKCENKQQLLARERFYIENYKCLNRNVPGRTRKEHYNDNKRQIVCKHKEYYKKHKEKIAEKARKHYENNKEAIKEKKKDYYKKNKEKLAKYKKEYNLKNKETLAKRSKEKYERNKEVILQKKKEKYQQNKNKINEKIKCSICGSIVMKRGLKRHQRSIKCKSFQNNIKY